MYTIPNRMYSTIDFIGLHKATRMPDAKMRNAFTHGGTLP
jgi:hypothetical protein